MSINSRFSRVTIFKHTCLSAYVPVNMFIYQDKAHFPSLCYCPLCDGPWEFRMSLKCACSKQVWKLQLTRALERLFHTTGLKSLTHTKNGVMPTFGRRAKILLSKVESMQVHTWESNCEVQMRYCMKNHLRSLMLGKYNFRENISWGKIRSI